MNLRGRKTWECRWEKEPEAVRLKDILSVHYCPVCIGVLPAGPGGPAGGSGLRGRHPTTASCPFRQDSDLYRYRNPILP